MAISSPDRLIGDLILRVHAELDQREERLSPFKCRDAAGAKRLAAALRKRLDDLDTHAGKLAIAMAHPKKRADAIYYLEFWTKQLRIESRNELAAIDAVLGLLEWDD